MEQENQNVTLKKITITPEYAKKLLESNYEKNRPIRLQYVNEIAIDIASGKWNEDICDPICITKDDILINGQHRLNAIIMANKPITTYVMRNVPISAYQYMDGGTPRKATDFMDCKNKELVSFLCKVAIAIKGGRQSSTSCIYRGILYQNCSSVKKVNILPTRLQIIEEHQRNEKIKDNAIELAQKMKSKISVGPTRVYAYFCYVLIITHNDEKLEEFVEDITLFPNCSAQSSLLKTTFLKKYAIKDSRPNDEFLIGILFNAYDCFRYDHKVKSFTNYRDYLAKYEKLIVEERNFHRNGKH